MGGLARPTSGDVCLRGASLRLASRRALLNHRRQDIGFVFQNAHLIDHLTARDNVILPLRYRGVGRSERNARADVLLSSVGLHGLGSRIAARLSGGERQRVAIARALINEPAIILADEPTGSLDQATGLEVMALLRGLVTAERSLVVVTHDHSHISQFDRVFRMEYGTLTVERDAPNSRSA